MPKFQGSSGQVYYRNWAADVPRAQIVFLHGYGEHSGLYHRFGDFLNSLGVDVWALDAIGHGLSDGVRGDPESMDNLRQNAELLTGIARQARPHLPLTLVGHSMGAMTAAHVLLGGTDRYRGAVLCGIPLEGIDEDMERLAADGVMSLDPFYLDELAFDPLRFDGTMAFTHLRKVFSPTVLAEIQAGLPKLSLPIAMATGDKDIFCPPELLKRWASRIPGADCHIFADSHHDLINDKNHSSVASVIAQTVLNWSAKQDL